MPRTVHTLGRTSWHSPRWWEWRRKRNINRFRKAILNADVPVYYCPTPMPEKRGVRYERRTTVVPRA